MCGRGKFHWFDLDRVVTALCYVFLKLLLGYKIMKRFLLSQALRIIQVRPKVFSSPQDVDVITPNPISFEYLFYRSSPLGACCQIARFILNDIGEDNPAAVVFSDS